MEAAGVTCGQRYALILGRLLEYFMQAQRQTLSLVGSNLALRPLLRRVRAESPPAAAGGPWISQRALTTCWLSEPIMMEAAGVEPASAIGSREASTCVER
jgi:hypothetical protein